MNMGATFQKSLITATSVLLLDFAFHFFFTRPMETLTYFVLKFLFSFLVATYIFNSKSFNNRPEKRKIIIPIGGLVFSALVSIYYRAWELGEAGVPFGSRAPDIIGVSRFNFLFPVIWGLGHALFFIIGAVIAVKLIREKND